MCFYPWESAVSRHRWQVGKPAVSADTMQVSLAVALEGSKPVTEGTQGVAMVHQDLHRE